LTKARPRPHARIAAAIAAASCIALATSACGSSSSSSGTLTIYNGQHEQTTGALVKAFERKTGISTAVRSDDEAVLANQIIQEGSKSPADVFYTENTPPLESLQGKGLLAKVDAATLSHTPAKYNSPDDDWVGVSARVSVIIYNPSLISASQLPAHVSQLAEPQYKGKLALAPQETDFQPIVTDYLRAYGQAATLSWLRSINANAAGHVYPDNETIADEVNRGAAAFGVVNQYYFYRMRAELGASNVHADITHFAAGDPGYVVDISGAGILKSSTHQAAAQKFLAFMVSKQAQDIIADPSKSISFEYPVADGVTTQAPETPLRQLQPYPITIAELGDGSTAISLMRQAGLL
jgi:iron(III) transport system substrate-binding protein